MNFASIDIGTNTVILLIARYESSSNKIIPIKNEYRIPRIGKGLTHGDKLLNEKILLLKKILTHFKKLADDYDCEKIFIAATQSFRTAINSREVIQSIKDELNLEIEIISGEDEAEFSFIGSIMELNSNSTALVIDIGGGSTEIFIGQKEKLLFRNSFKFGVVSLQEKFALSAQNIISKDSLMKINDYLANELNELKHIPRAPYITIAVAGTATTLASIKLGISTFKESNIDGIKITITELNSIVEKLSVLSYFEVLQKFGKIVEGREDLILIGSLILLNICKLLEIDEIIVSTKGLRYGYAIHKLKAKDLHSSG
jgi:exopolyphosphatase/guanosine-5'-triphosphate,3'-diphosphate pyrophosphatase